MNRTLHRLLAVASASALLLAGEKPVQASFSSNDKGTTTADFLKLGVGARGEAMGEAFSALVDDANALYWNPAALTQIPENSGSATFMHAPYIDPTYYDFAGYAQNTAHGAFGAGLQYFSGGSITQTDTTGTGLGTFSPYDVAASLSYAHTIEGYGLGLTGKYIRSQLLDSAQTEAMDIGVLTPAYANERLRLAFVASNIGGKMRFEQESFGLPLNLKIGSAYRITSAWVGTMDVNAPIDNAPYVAFGTEYKWMMPGGWAVSGRAGYNTRSAGDIDGLTGFTTGLGVDLKSYSIDYAMVPMGVLGLTQRISVSMRFGAGAPQTVIQHQARGSDFDPFTDLLASTDSSATR